MLHRYRSNPSHVIPPFEIEIQPNMTTDQNSSSIGYRIKKKTHSFSESFMVTSWCRRGYMGARESYEKILP
ncbi:hypothetical protein EPI10_001137 [Gossypium australe]|uniref:Uncharacterized protein n=1 Tax=Gossypium australe TaxID=47621 RepID=A0A5B6V9Z2_9ROSI|nr:hypothetical protein EPI10_001137 [Gossypium australe]